MTFNRSDINAALEIAADEIEYAYQHGLHEHGIPVPEILRSQRHSAHHDSSFLNELADLDRYYRGTPPGDWATAWELFKRAMRLLAGVAPRHSGNP